MPNNEKKKLAQRDIFHQWKTSFREEKNVRANLTGTSVDENVTWFVSIGNQAVDVLETKVTTPEHKNKNRECIINTARCENQTRGIWVNKIYRYLKNSNSNHNNSNTDSSKDNKSNNSNKNNKSNKDNNNNNNQQQQECNLTKE